jgi:hypothetical protein
MIQDIINETNNLDDANNKIRNIATKLLTHLDESEVLFQRNTDRSFIIGYLQGYIRSEMQELASIREEIRKINWSIQQHIEQLQD